jgi:hypothetical protein
MHRNQSESMAKKLGFSIAHHFSWSNKPGFCQKPGLWNKEKGQRIECLSPLMRFY